MSGMVLVGWLALSMEQPISELGNRFSSPKSIVNVCKRFRFQLQKDGSAGVVKKSAFAVCLGWSPSIAYHHVGNLWQGKKSIPASLFSSKRRE